MKLMYLVVGYGVPGGSVGLNQVHTYRFDVPTNLLEGSSEPCLSFLYTSMHDPVRDHNTGLVGAILVCQKGYLAYRGPKPSEYFLLLATFDENKSLYMSPTVSVGNDLEGFVQSNVRWTVNGYSYGNMPTINTCINDNIIWHVMSLGSFLDVHTLVFDGNTFNEEGTNRDARSLVPGSTAALSMTPDNAGKWMLYSQSTTARENGMFAFYTVTDCYGKSGDDVEMHGRIRDYYISAEEVLWDYAPLTRSPITGANLLDPNVEESIFIRHDDMYIGHVYKKAVYKEYTDGTYTSVKPGNGDLLGPVIMAEVGDVVRVTFRNMATRRYSIHSHGVLTE
ncbi:ferroxidase HEPHL1-like [Physella acuta]|uniref:ferroxidase HEPHL1-like n=1 Tax=Physella acuta TaxID=109671 RepID=UPI0027DE89C8|nr:ferroxidase HEPHL1-like [Physella acuta]